MTYSVPFEPKINVQDLTLKPQSLLQMQLLLKGFEQALNVSLGGYQDNLKTPVVPLIVSDVFKELVLRNNDEVSETTTYSPNLSFYQFTDDFGRQDLLIMEVSEKQQFCLIDVPLVDEKEPLMVIAPFYPDVHTDHFTLCWRILQNKIAIHRGTWGAIFESLRSGYVMMFAVLYALKDAVVLEQKAGIDDLLRHITFLTQSAMIAFLKRVAEIHIQDFSYKGEHIKAFNQNPTLFSDFTHLSVISPLSDQEIQLMTWFWGTLASSEILMATFKTLFEMGELELRNLLYWGCAVADKFCKGLPKERADDCDD